MATPASTVPTAAYLPPDQHPAITYAAETSSVMSVRTSTSDTGAKTDSVIATNATRTAPVARQRNNWLRPARPAPSPQRRD